MAKRVIVWGINYAPELVGIAVYTTEMCEFLNRSGVELVVVSAFPYYPAWRLQESRPLYASERIRGVQVERCMLYVPAKPSTWRRIVHELSFAISSFFRLLIIPRADTYVVVSPPLILGFFAALLCLLKSSRYIFHVQDLQPDASMALAMIKNGLFFKVLKLLEKLAYCRACQVTCISEQMRQKIVEGGISGDKVAVFPNWVSSVAPEGGWRSHVGLSPEKFVVSYSGNMGMKQGLDTIIESAKLLRHRNEIVFVLGGQGSQRDHLLELVRTENLTNVIFQDLLEERLHTAMLCETDVFVVPQKPGSGAIFFPSKLLKAIALGCPILTNADSSSSLHQAVVEGGFGVIIPPSQSREFATALEQLCDNPERRAELGANGMTYAKRFSTQAILPQFLDLLNSVNEHDTRSLQQSSRQGEP